MADAGGLLGVRELKVIRTISLVAAFFCLPTLVHADTTKTFYDYLKDSWAFGEIAVVAPLEYRDGGLLAFPGRITDLIHARYGKPRSVLVIYEVKDPAVPLPFEKDTSFVAPLRVLPRTKYWRDNLPTSPRHEVLGGVRYVFTGDDAARAKELGGAYAATLGMEMPDRKLRQGEIVAGALSSPVEVLRDDSVSFLSGRTLTHINEKATAAMTAFAAGDAPVDQRVAIIDAIGRAKLAGAKPQIEKLAKSGGEIGAAASRALGALAPAADSDGES